MTGSGARRPWRFSLWPQSLFGRLIGALLVGALLAQAAALVLIAREREHFVLQVSVRDWSRRIADITALLLPMDVDERAETVERLILRQPRRPGRLAPSDRAASLLRLPGLLPGEGPVPLDGHGFPGPPPGGVPHPPHKRSSLTATLMFVPVPLGVDFESTLKQQLRSALGSAFDIQVSPTQRPEGLAIPVSGPFFDPVEGPGQLYDVSVRFPDGYLAVFRLARQPWGAPLSRNLVLNLGLLVLVMVIAMYVTARSITRPLWELARAADNLGRDPRQPPLEEKGARELRNAARAFNTMQDRLRRYLDTRTPVLAAMSHDLRTPLTRLRLHVELLEDPVVQARAAKELDEMESMIRASLAQLKGLDDDEPRTPLDINELLATLQSECAQVGGQVRIEGRAPELITAKPHALKRCLMNLLDNAIKFGGRALIQVEVDGALIVRVRDEGPGIPPEELERVFQPFYRVEGSRNRETGGTGLGLSIARDVAQAHGGSLVLRNLPERGLEALLVLPLDP